MTGCIVQALVSQGISIALGCTFTTQPADHLIVSPRSRGSNLRDKPDPCGNLTYRMMYSVFYVSIVDWKDWECQEKITFPGSAPLRIGVQGGYGRVHPELPVPNQEVYKSIYILFHQFRIEE